MNSLLNSWEHLLSLDDRSFLHVIVAAVDIYLLSSIVIWDSDLSAGYQLVVESITKRVREAD